MVTLQGYLEHFEESFYQKKILQLIKFNNKMTLDALKNVTGFKGFVKTTLLNIAILLLRKSIEHIYVKLITRVPNEFGNLQNSEKKTLSLKLADVLDILSTLSEEDRNQILKQLKQ